MEENYLELFILSIFIGMAVRMLFFPDAWEIAWKIMSETLDVFRK